nr:PREDICTED: H-2 class I histocompatibility antigen, K-K alpha chain-like [Pundamilia nyererei]
MLSEKHSLRFFLTSLNGVTEFPDFLAFALLTKQSTQNCRSYRQIFKSESNKFKEHFNHTGGVHVVQQMAGCEWDDVTGDIVDYQQYGYDGEDLISLDLKTLTLITARPQAVVTKHEWDGDKYRCPATIPDPAPETGQVEFKLAVTLDPLTLTPDPWTRSHATPFCVHLAMATPWSPLLPR